MKNIGIITFLALLLCSCATRTKVEYVDREVVKYETKIQHDTLIRDTHDSIYHTIFQKGDTVYDTKYVEKTKYRDRIVVKIDTCFRDSVSIETKEVTIEKRVVPKWCYICLAVCIVFVGFYVIKIVRWLKII